MNASTVCKLIQEHLAAKLGVRPEAVNPAERFRRLGVDSLAATAMLTALGAHLGRQLSPTLAWQYPTPMDLARHLAGEVEVVDVPVGRKRATADEPIAIVGLACRLPGAPDPEAFWRLLRRGGDAIREVPRDRWDLDALFDADKSVPGKMSTRFGGFLDDVGAFDASFFGISPREAIDMDPQQRLMMELSWEALEDAGLPPPSLKDTRAGVFFGAMWMDYTRLPGATPDRIGVHTATGQDLSIVPARVSYTLGLLGPSVAVNTACSSSIVALHMARHSLLRGESNLALAGGVNLVLSPESTIAMSKFGAMAPDGRCKAFDARANGYVRGEGGGVVVLKRLSDALADGDRIYCVIRGTAINNDGFSNGLTAPSPRAQEGVLRDAYADAGMAFDEVQYIETHGTGTMLGDPIEAGAIGAVLGPSRAADRPLRIGSVKTNIGHLEAAAGMAGLIKVALSMAHRELPATIHFQKPNPHIPFEQLRLRVQATHEPWEVDGGRRVAGVSSFGFGGTNAHAIVESTEPPRSVRLAAASAADLAREAERLLAAVRASPSALDAIPDASDAPYRLAVTVTSARELADHLDGFLKGTPQPGLLSGQATAPPPSVVLVFGGQGSQWLGMGRALLRDEPAARTVLEQCDRAIRAFAGWSLIERLHSDDAALLDRTDYVQPALFSMQVALAQAMRARGLRFDAVVGQSMGEVAAAHVAGALSLSDAIRVMCVRSQLVGKAQGGRMLVAGLSLEATAAAIAPYGEHLSVAVAAGPASTVVAGAEDAVARLHADLEAKGVAARVVRVDYASHSRYMDPLLPELERLLAPVRPRHGEVAFWSTVTGEPVDGASLDAAYWARNLRQPVLFAPTVERLAQRGPTVFVEVDPHPVLALFVEQCVAHAGARGTVVGCAGRDEPEPLTLREAAGRLFVAGSAVAAEPSLVASATAGAAPARDRSAELVVVSAKTPEALRAAAGRLRDHLGAHPGQSLGDLSYSSIATRAPMECRLALAVSSREALAESLDAAAGDETPVATADVGGGPPRVAFVFPGQGSQWLGMGRELLREEPAFAEALGECDRAIAAEAGWSLLEELQAPPAASRLDRIDVVQPVLFAMEVALAALWRSWGVEPHAVVGHSMGEIAAACVAGALSLEDGVAVICRRSALMKRISGQGEMALVELSIDEAKAAIAGFEDRLGVAVSNGTRSTVLSGDPAALAQVLATLEAREVFCRRVKVDVASHSPQMDPLLDELVAKVAGVSPRAAQVPMRSTVTGKTIEGAELVARYWADNLRQPVRFAHVVQGLLADGFTLFVEMSPHPILVQAVEALRKEQGIVGLATGSLRREQPERRTLLESLGGLFVHGEPLDARRLFPAGARRVPLPTYPWQRERYWLAPAAPQRVTGAASAHPLLGARVPLASADAVYESVLSTTEPAWLTDHRVAGKALVPGAALAELARAAGEDHAGRPSQVTGLVFQAPLVLPESGARLVQVVLTDGGGHASIYSRASDVDPATPWKLHATADVSASPAATQARVDLAGARRRCAEAVDVASVYARFAALGLHYGPAFQGLRALSRGPGEALAEIALPSGLDSEGFGAHPAQLDAALQAVLGALASELGGAPLPFEIGRFVVHGPMPSPAWVHVRLDAPAAASVSADVVVTDASGAVLVEVGGVRMRQADLASLGRPDAEAVPDAFHRLEWPVVDAPARPKPPPAGRWAVVVEGERAAASALADALRAAGASAEEVDVAKLHDAVADHVVCVWDGGAGDAEAAIRAATAGLAVARAVMGRKEPPRLWWVTRGAVGVSAGEDVAASAAAVWGLGRTLMHEQPELRCTLLDVGRDGPIAEALLREVAAAGDGAAGESSFESSFESQVAWRGDVRHVARLMRAPPAAALAGENYRLEAKRKGTLDGLALTSTPRRAPAPGEVEIEVGASGVNFRDVLNALGMYPGEPAPLGCECAGVVVRAGAGVTTLAVGEPVMALVSGGIGRFVSVDARMAARVPAGLSIEQAATVPAVFLTAWYALHDLAKLKRGERLLVHAAAGGVGMAALQVARWIGADLFATASPSKWDVVRSLGVKHVANSRDTTFVPAVRAAAGGVDVVLGALAGELVDASLSLLSPGGRYIEMGKTDLRDAAAVSAAHPGVTYQAFDLFQTSPDRVAAMFAAVLEGFAAGHLTALPVRAFPVTEAESAFRFMAQARHVGKLALVTARDALRVDGTALITGGLGALGLEVARDFARRGMRHLVLTGRRGLETPGAAEAVRELEALGARVTVAAVDVADRPALGRVVAAIPADLPLRAVVHAAVVLDDGMLADQTPARFRKVMAPKVLGAANLHALTEKADLDAFVLFSSMVGTLGNASQGAYGAANAYLDALAAHRRAGGLPAVSLAWGPWAELGLAAGLNAKLQARFAGQGLAMIAPAAGMALFDKALTRAESQLVVVPIDLRAAARAFGASVPPVWRALVRPAPPPRAAAPGGTWASDLAALPAERRLEAVVQTVRAEVARVLSLGRATAVPVDRPMRELGLDSLMAVELRNALGRRAAVTLPANLAFDHPTPAAIAKYLLAHVPSLADATVTATVETSRVAQNGSAENGSAEKAVLAPPRALDELAVPAAASTPAAPPRPALARPADVIDTIPMGERWLADGFRVIPAAGGFAQGMVDMTRATAAINALGEAGLRGTFTHILVRAAALALARNPRLHQSIIGYRKLTPGAVDIGLSMAGQTTYAPVVVLPAVDRTPLRALIGVVEEAITAARLKETVDLANMRRVGWMTPFGFFRRFVIRWLQSSFWFRRRIVGTFQVSSVPTVDAAVPLQFYAGSILSFGRVRSTVVAIDGRIETRPMLSITICVEHVAMDSTRAAALLNAIAALLEGEELVDEAREAAREGARRIDAPRAASRPSAALPPPSGE
jgi:acyl transferase domain-containing protein/NADPH:quinone reductase-like Zn-dependent oxidoreductase/NAD(P)-dependent dehydrogenase (short-subunit alcohol dehydrogenase family)/acyl carrier protein